MNSYVISYGALLSLLISVSLCPMSKSLDDEVKLYNIPYVIDENCFKRITPIKKQYGVREFAREFTLRHTPFAQKFMHYNAYEVQKGLTHTFKDCPQDLVMPQAPVFNWEKPCCILGEAVLKSGYKNYLQDFSGTNSGVKVYEIPSGEPIIRKAPVTRIWWADDETCCAVICKESESSSCCYYAFLRDLKNNKEFCVECAAPGPDTLSYFIDFGHDLRFVTKINNVLNVKRIRPEGEDIIVDEYCTMVNVYFCDRYIWVYYKKKKVDIKKEKLLSPISEERLGVYEVLKNSLKLVTNVVLYCPPKYVFDPYGLPADKQYISFLQGENLVVYNAATAEVVYENKQNYGTRLVGIWNSDGTRYAVSDVTGKGCIVVHDIWTDTVVKLENSDNSVMIADIGFQGNYVGVSSADFFMIYDCRNGTLVKRIPLSNEEPKKSYSKNSTEYGFCAPDCVYVSYENELMIYNFIKYSAEVTLQHTPNMKEVVCGEKFFGYAVLQDFKKLSLVTMMLALVKNFSYDFIHDFWFTPSGDQLLIVHGKDDIILDIVDTLSGKVLMALPLGSYAYKIVLSADNTLCAVLFLDKKSITLYDLNDTLPVKKLKYTSEVTSMKFDEVVSVFVVTTNDATYAYSAQDQ